MKSQANIRPPHPIKLYRAAVSGHSHRVELFLSLLGLPFELIDVNLAAGEQKTPEFLKMNPFGQIPVIQDGSVTLADSNAILVYLAQRYGADPWLPQEPVRAARVQSWLSVASGLVAFGPAAARAIVLFARPYNADEVIARAQGLFAVMEQALQQQDFLVGNQVTIADVANYAYVARAPEGNISLEPFPHIRAWLARIEELPGFVSMMRSLVEGIAP
jgi:glutathione S-transferase